MGCLDIPNETVFTMEITPVKVGPGATDEVAYDLKRLGVKHPLIITDHGVMKLGLPERVRSLLQEGGLSADIFDDVHVEPTDKSFEVDSPDHISRLHEVERGEGYAHRCGPPVLRDSGL